VAVGDGETAAGEAEAEAEIEAKGARRQAANNPTITNKKRKK